MLDTSLLNGVLALSLLLIHCRLSIYCNGPLFGTKLESAQYFAFIVVISMESVHIFTTNKTPKAKDGLKMAQASDSLPPFEMYICIARSMDHDASPWQHRFAKYAPWPPCVIEYDRHGQRLLCVLLCMYGTSHWANTKCAHTITTVAALPDPCR